MYRLGKQCSRVAVSGAYLKISRMNKVKDGKEMQENVLQKEKTEACFLCIYTEPI